MTAQVTSLQPLRRRRNVAKLIAKLETHGLRLGGEVGSTSRPPETSLDVAAALGIAAKRGPGPRLAVSVLCLRLWPSLFNGLSVAVGMRDVIVTSDRNFYALVGDAVVRERRTLRHTVQVPVERPSETPAYRALASLLERFLRTHIAADIEDEAEMLGRHLWREASGLRGIRPRRRRRPALPPELAARALQTGFLATWARAIIAEYRQPNHCQACYGYGERLTLQSDARGVTKAIVTVCEHCYGQGVTAWSKHRRARELSIGVKPYRHYLNEHTADALGLLRTLEYRGARAVLSAMGIEEE